MCGRFTLTVTMEELMSIYDLEEAPSFHQPRYNISPGQMVPAIIHDGKKNRIGQLRWGLIPEWSKTEKLKVPTFNARAETVREKPMFRKPFLRKRCVIPADSFYEWKKEGQKNQPWRIMLKNKQVFSMAGLYDTWIREDGTKISTCTVITTQANDLISGLHHRMPVILRPEDVPVWLDRENQDAQELESYLQPYPGESMTVYRVSPIVGNVRNDVPECIEPWDEQE